MFSCIAGCAFAVGALQGENLYCIDVFFVVYQSCGYSSILSWMKNGCAATVVIGKVSPLHPILNTRTKFFCDKLHEDIIIQKNPSFKVQISLPADTPR